MISMSLLCFHFPCMSLGFLWHLMQLKAPYTTANIRTYPVPICPPYLCEALCCVVGVRLSRTLWPEA